MQKSDYIAAAVREIESPEFAYTRQILDVNEVAMEDGRYKVEDVIEKENRVDVFFAIKDQQYFLRISLDKESGEVVFPNIQNANYCYLDAVSETKSLSELASFTKIKYTGGYSKGDVLKFGNRERTAKLSSISFELLDTLCLDTEDAIGKLLDKLSADKDGIKKLIENSDAVIRVCKNQYVSANAGFSMSPALVKRLSEFGLGIDIDTYIVGERLG